MHVKVTVIPSIFVDTELWIYSLKVPAMENYSTKEHHEQDMQRHLQVRSFFKTLESDVVFFFTTHQLCEIYHALRFRGKKMDADFSRAFIDSIMNADTSRIIEPSKDDVKKSIELSLASNIHVWDFLCIVPIKDAIGVIYTSDKHFTSEAMRTLGVNIENPIATWDEL